MNTEDLILFSYLILWIFIFIIWLYGKYVVIRSLYNQKYQDKIDYLKSITLYYPIWKYMEINQIVFRMILKGEIK